MSEAIELLHQDFVQKALAAALIIAVLGSFLGVFVVLKRIVFVGAALSEIAGLGAALGFAPPVAWAVETLAHTVPGLGKLEHHGPQVLALALMLVAVAFFAQPGLGRRLPREAIIGAAFAGAVGLTVLVLSKTPENEHVRDVLNGNIIGVEWPDIAELGTVAGLVGLVQLLFYKEFVLVSFDPEVARTLGYRSAAWELVWYLTLGIMIAVSIHVAGPVLVFSYLVVPAVSALLLSRRLGVVLLLSVLFGVATTFVGVLISVSPIDLPTGPTIVGCQVALFVVCWVLQSLGGLRPVKA